MPLSAPAFRCLQREISDPEAFVDAVSSSHLTVELHGRMNQAASIEQFQSPQWALDFSETHVKGRVYGELPGGWAAICLVRSWTASRWYGHDSSPGTLFCNPPGVGLDGVVSPGFVWISLSIAPSIWEEASRLAGVDSPPPLGFSGWTLPAPLFRQLEAQALETRELIRRALRDPRFSQSADRAMLDFARCVATLLWDKMACPLPATSSLQSRVRLARRAEAWMREHLMEAITIPDVCLALRVSRRELEYAFNAAFDSSPKAFLHKLRLNTIHRILRHGREAGLSVTQIAMDYGITHLGRFAGEYRALFGESPAATLGMRRKTAPRGRLLT